MLMAAAALLRDKPQPTEEEINSAMTNLCRCGTYPRVKRAILRASGQRRRHMKPESDVTARLYRRGSGCRRVGALLYERGAESAGRHRAPARLLNGWIRIAPDGAVSVFSRTTEMGQGALTSLALIVAEELELDPASVTVEMAPVTEEFMERTRGGAPPITSPGPVSRAAIWIAAYARSRRP